MLKNKLYENLDGYQLGILEEALKGKTIEEADDVDKVFSNVQGQEYDAHLDWGGISPEAQDNFNEVYRYLNSQKEDEETRKEKFAHYVQKEYTELQATVNKYIEEGKLTPEEIYEYGAGTENCMLNHAEIKFGFKGLDSNLELDFHGIDELESVGV